LLFFPFSGRKGKRQSAFGGKRLICGRLWEQGVFAVA